MNYNGERTNKIFKKIRYYGNIIVITDFRQM